jgi:hypothetical protein
MSQVLKPPPAVLLHATRLLERAVLQLVDSWASLPPFDTYEADVECWNILKLIGRQVEGVITLAESDLVLLPSAMVLTRSVFEAAAKCMWMLAPEDPFNREVRWLAHLQSEEDFLRKAADLSDRGGPSEDAAKNRSRAEQFRDFRTQFIAKLPTGYCPLVKLPNMFEMLDSVGEAHKYLIYVWGCQYAHGTHAAVGLYRKHLGNKMEFGEYIRLRDWYFCLIVSWWSLIGPGNLFLQRMGGDHRLFPTVELSEGLENAFKQLKGADDPA